MKKVMDLCEVLKCSTVVTHVEMITVESVDKLENVIKIEMHHQMVRELFDKHLVVINKEFNPCTMCYTYTASLFIPGLDKLNTEIVTKSDFT